MIQLSVERKPIHPPRGFCDPHDIESAVEKSNPPFMVAQPESGKWFSVRRRVYLSVGENVRVECEDAGELGLACKLVAAEHNNDQLHEDDDTREVLADTERVEDEVKKWMEAPLEEDEKEEKVIDEDDDISMEEWSQMGYRWFQSC